MSTDEINRPATSVNPSPPARPLSCNTLNQIVPRLPTCKGSSSPQTPVSPTANYLTIVDGSDKEVIPDHRHSNNDTEDVTLVDNDMYTADFNTESVHSNKSTSIPQSPLYGSINSGPQSPLYSPIGSSTNSPLYSPIHVGSSPQSPLYSPIGSGPQSPLYSPIGSGPQSPLYGPINSDTQSSANYLTLVETNDARPESEGVFFVDNDIYTTDFNNN